jgi:hypothetical protein
MGLMVDLGLKERISFTLGLHNAAWRWWIDTAISLEIDSADYRDNINIRSYDLRFLSSTEC